MKDEKILTRGDITENEAVSKLEILDVSLGDMGQYIVKIENVAGIAQYAVHVSVRELTPEVRETENFSEPEIANIVERLKDKTFAEGEDIVLRCRVNGNPTPTGIKLRHFHWFMKLAGSTPTCTRMFQNTHIDYVT